MPRGSVQLEAGSTLGLDSGSETVSGPEALLRWAPIGGAELRVGLPDYVWADDTRGFGDASLGVKLELGTAGPWTAGTVLSTSLPTGEDGIGGAPVSPSAILAVTRGLPRGLGLSAQTELRWNRAADDVAVGGTVLLSAPVAPRVSAFGEAAATVSGGPAEAYLQAGTTVAAASALQVDARAAIGLTRASTAFQIGLGVSTRW